MPDVYEVQFAQVTTRMGRLLVPGATSKEHAEELALTRLMGITWDKDAASASEPEIVSTEVYGKQ